MPTDNEYLRLIYNSLNAADLIAQPNIIVGTMTGSNDTRAVVLAGRSRVSIGLNITNISPNASVGIGLRCLLYTGGPLYPLSADGNAVMTITANGLYLYTWEGSADSIIIKFDYELGGTGAVVQFAARAQ
jgi:hypothetical protein